MKKKVLVFIALVSAAFACSDFKVTTTEDGDRIQYHVKGDGNSPNIGDIIVLDLHLTDENDTTYRNTFEEEEPLKIPVMKGQFKGSFESAFMHLSEGDSATVFVKIDSLYGAMQQPLPPNVSTGSDLKFRVAIRDILTQEENAAQLEEKKNAEDQIIQEYVATSMVGADSLGGYGIFYTLENKGNGREPSRGDSVIVQYSGRLMNGKVFDASSPADPFVFPVGMGYVIKGWDAAILAMKKGQKGTYIIPSRLAYGERGAGGRIPPFAPLIFDIELVDIKRAK